MPMDLKANSASFLSFPPAVSESGDYLPVSLWQETVDIAPGPALAEDVACDVAIVGGGFTGLSVAYHLKKAKPDIEVVLIERAVIGHGASGRNGGFAMPLLGWDLLYTVEKLGEDVARSAYRLMYDAVEYVKSTIKQHQINCDLETTGYVFLNTCASREARARKEYDAAHRLGFDHEWLDRKQLGEYIRSGHFRSGVFDPHPCVINPAKLARGMKKVVEDMGVRVFEQSPLDALVDGASVRLHTSGGRIQAKQAVLAVNGYGASLGFMEARVLPIHTYIVATEPLEAAQLDVVGWSKKRASLETARNLIHYFRLTADNRILFGGEDAQVYYGGVYKDKDPRIIEAACHMDAVSQHAILQSEFKFRIEPVFDPAEG